MWYKISLIINMKVSPPRRVCRGFFFPPSVSWHFRDYRFLICYSTSQSLLTTPFFFLPSPLHPPHPPLHSLILSSSFCHQLVLAVGPTPLWRNGQWADEEEQGKGGWGAEKGRRRRRRRIRNGEGERNGRFGKELYSWFSIPGPTLNLYLPTLLIWFFMLPFLFLLQMFISFRHCWHVRCYRGRKQSVRY